MYLGVALRGVLPAPSRILQSIESSELQRKLLLTDFIFLCKTWNYFVLFWNRFLYFSVKTETISCSFGTDFHIFVQILKPFLAFSAMPQLLYMPTTVTSVGAIRAMGCAESYYSWPPTIKCSSRKPRELKNYWSHFGWVQWKIRCIISCWFFTGAGGISGNLTLFKIFWTLVVGFGQNETFSFINNFLISVLIFHDRFVHPILQHACMWFVCVFDRRIMCLHATTVSPSLGTPLRPSPVSPCYVGFGPNSHASCIPPIAHVLDSQSSCWRCVLGYIINSFSSHVSYTHYLHL